MRILILDDNLFWSVRLQRGAAALGHEAIVIASVPPVWPAADAAILNLGHATLASDAVIAGLHNAGIATIGHAGHKETEVLDEGLRRGCQHLVTNSQLTHKLADSLSLVHAK